MLKYTGKPPAIICSNLGLRLIILTTLVVSACGDNGSSPSAPSGQEINTSAQPSLPAIAPNVEDLADNKKHSSDCISSGGCIKWETPERQSALQKLEQEQFTEAKIHTISELSKLIPPSRLDEVIEILDACSCDQEQLSVYQKQGIQKLIIVARGEKPTIYPTVISVNDLKTREIKLNYGFMYDTGSIRAITDVNNNGYVEFWLNGAITECEEGCGPDGGNGTAVVEETEDDFCLRAEPMDFIDVTAGFADGTGKAALFNTPNGIAVDRNNLYVADTSNNRIRKVDATTGVVTTLAGSNTTCPADGTGNAASFNGPQGIVASGGSLYVTDTLNHKIRKIEMATGTVTTLAGSGEKGATDGVGAAATFNQPYGITTDDKNLYVTDYFNNKIRKIEIATGSVTTLAGSGRLDLVAGGGARDGCDDGIGKAASFCHPTGITFFNGNLYVVDEYWPEIRKISIASGVVTTFSGTGGHGNADGTASKADFSRATGITSDGHNLYVADAINYIRKVDMATGVVSTLPNVNRRTVVWGVFASGKNLYVTTGKNSILKIDTSNNVTTTLAGFEHVQADPKNAEAMSERDNSGSDSE